jgi:Putative Mg2+ and Co2+ transporter CorB
MMSALIIFCCWIVSFLFNGIESGLLSIDPVRLRQNVKRRVPAAVRLNRLLKHPERLLVTVLLFTNAADILGLFLLTRELVRSWGFAGYFISVAIALPVYLFLLLSSPEIAFPPISISCACSACRHTRTSAPLFSPLLELGARLGKLLLPGRAARRARLFAGREDLKQITTQSEVEGSLTATERAMIHNVVDFRIVKVRDVMLPSPKVVALPPSASTGKQSSLALLPALIVCP